MIKADLITIDGKKENKISLSEKIFSVSENLPLVAQSVRVYLSNQRKASAKVKTRGEVSGSGRKIWRQKGTGRARHGDQYAPIFVGGGIAHGPTGKENYKLKMPKKMKKTALCSALSIKMHDKAIVFVEDVSKVGQKTKKMNEFLRALKIDVKKKTPNILVVIPEISEKNTVSGRNIAGLNYTKPGFLNAYVVSNSDLIIFDKRAVEALEIFLGLKKEKNESVNSN